MFFEATSNGKNYQVNVNETRKAWKVSISSDDNGWTHYDISTDDYQYLDETISFIFKNSSYLLDVVSDGTEYQVFTRGSYRQIDISNEEMLLHESLKKGGAFGGGDSLTSGMPGKIVDIMVEVGDKVSAGQPILIMEAMKMENEMKASEDAIIADIHVAPGDSVESGAQLISFSPIEE